SIIAYTPLARGILTGKFHENPDTIKTRSVFRRYTKAFKPEGLEQSRPLINALRTLAEKYQVSISQIALNWIINFHGNTIVAIPGATSVEQARDNADSMRFRLTKDELDFLDRESSIYKS
ncbi:MAG: aldo/keto reductase, partial [Thermodesulfobacteriota bacterium]